jgi:hypothetical protein
VQAWESGFSAGRYWHSTGKHGADTVPESIGEQIIAFLGMKVVDLEVYSTISEFITLLGVTLKKD